MKQKLIFQFKIELIGIEPKIWRMIQVPSTYSFWDLHVAIQDSMGWLDYHLHTFIINQLRRKKPIEIGIPENEFDKSLLPGWEILINKYFKAPGDEARYEYDYGDDWQHIITLEEIVKANERINYPICIDGRRACPPEDCGSIPGYYQMLEILKQPKHEEYEEYVDWLKNHAKNYYPYNPDFFEPEKVDFWDPKERFKIAFQNP